MQDNVHCIVIIYLTSASCVIWDVLSAFAHLDAQTPLESDFCLILLFEFGAIVNFAYFQESFIIEVLGSLLEPVQTVMSSF